MRIAILMALALIISSLAGVALANGGQLKEEINQTKGQLKQLRIEKKDVRAKLLKANAILADLRARRDQASSKNERQSLKSKLSYERALKSALKDQRDAIAARITETKAHLDYLKQLRANR